MMKKKTVNIDGESYELDSLSDLLKKQIISLRFADLEIERTNNLLALLKTARAAYAASVKEELLKNK